MYCPSIENIATTYIIISTLYHCKTFLKTITLNRYLLYIYNYFLITQKQTASSNLIHKT